MKMGFTNQIAKMPIFALINDDGGRNLIKHDKIILYAIIS